MDSHAKKIMWALLRIALGWIFLWAFLDKTFGFGYTTSPDKSWLKGFSPTDNFLRFGATGKYGHYFTQLAGNRFIDWLFMLGLLFIGVTLITGIALKLGSISGIILVSLIFLTIAPTANNPVLDQHVIYALIFFGLLFDSENETLSLGWWWQNLPIIENITILH
jgi:thiosulfate dehydrogenase (quinone) large subunit